MALTIPPENEATRQTCPECGSPMERQQVTGDQREASTSTHALLCTNTSCGHREGS